MEPEFHEYHDHKDDDADLQEVEDLLETYFTHIDSTFAELEALDEFIDDTEDFVNIELDSQRNQLIKLELVLTTATLFVSMYGVVASIFGMNLKNGSEDSHAMFVLVNAVCAAGTIPALCRRVLHQVQADHVRGQRVGRGRRDERARATIGVMGVKSDDHRPRRRTRLVDLGGR